MNITTTLNEELDEITFVHRSKLDFIESLIYIHTSKIYDVLLAQLATLDEDMASKVFDMHKDV
jgi:hypothetical protein